MKKTLKTLQKLAEEYDFNEPLEYLDYIVDSFINGLKTQAKTLFLQMDAEGRNELFNFLEFETGSKYQLREFMIEILIQESVKHY